MTCEWFGMCSSTATHESWLKPFEDDNAIEWHALCPRHARAWTKVINENKPTRLDPSTISPDEVAPALSSSSA